MQKVAQPTQPITLPHLSAQPTSSLLKLLDAFLRRGLDLTVALLGLLLLSPVFFILSSVIRRDSPGPVFYRGPRAGLRGKPFGILKFRTMYDRPASFQGAKITAQDDDRITPLGRWLRDTKLNELPQLWNVLVGDMSLVGPRPEDPTIAAAWPDALKTELLSVRPGITSPATVLFRGEESMLSSTNVMDEYLRTILPSKLRLDSLYIRNRNLITDLDVLFWTAVILLPRVRTETIPTRMLYWGPLSRIFTHYLSWFCVDSLIALLAVSISGVVWRTAGPLDLGWPAAVLVALVTTLLFSAVNSLLGLDHVEWNRAPAGYTLLLALSTALSAFALLSTHQFVLVSASLPHGLIIDAGLLAFLGFVVVRYRERLLTGLASRWMALRGGVRAVGERVLIVGAGDNCTLAAWFFNRGQLGQAFNVVGLVDDDPRKHGQWIESFRVLGTTADIPALVKQHDIGIVLFTISNISPDERRRILQLCHASQILVVLLPDILADLTSKFRLANTISWEEVP